MARRGTPVYVEWIDMPGGVRRELDGPFDWVTFTYDEIRVGKGDTDDFIGYRYHGGGWVREGDDSEGHAPEFMTVFGWYSDVSIITDPDTVCEKWIEVSEDGDVLDSSGRCDECRP